LAASRAILKGRRSKNANALIVSNDPRCSTSRGIEQGSPAAQPSRQRRDKEKYWTRRVSTSAASGLLSFQLTQRRCGRNINGGGIIFRSLKGTGRGENRINNSVPNPTPPCAYLMHSSLIHVSWRRLASKFLRCLDADRGGRERGD
jgi:hypothetical protein